MKTSPLLLAVLFFGGLGPLMAENLFPEGNFELLGAEGKPESWSVPHPSYLVKIQGKADLEVEEDNHFMRLSLENPDNACHVSAEVPLPESAANVVISYRVRCSDLVPAASPDWAGVFNGGGFLDANGEVMEGFKGPKRQKAATDGWVEVEDVFQVPVGAKQVRIQAGLYHTTGTADFDDFVVSVE
jgi:hypothetical protein